MTSKHPYLYDAAAVVESAEHVGQQAVLVVDTLPQVQHPVTQHAQELQADLHAHTGQGRRHMCGGERGSTGIWRYRYASTGRTCMKVQAVQTYGEAPDR